MTPPAPSPKMQLPTDHKERKRIPLMKGCVDYFPAALMEVAKLSLVGNEQHNPGEPLHHARDKSMDHDEAILRHQVDRGLLDTDGVRHSTKVAWRALAQLQEEMEAAGAPMARGAMPPEPKAPDLRAKAVDEALSNFDFGWCYSEEPLRKDGYRTWNCSRRPGHTGEHAATDPIRSAVRVWPQEPK